MLLQHNGFFRSILIGLISFNCMFYLTACQGKVAGEPIIRRSDVAALSHYREIETFQAYRPTVIAWGWPQAYPRGMTPDNRNDMIRENIETAYQQGVRIVTANIDMVTATAWILSENPELQDAVVRDIHNEPMLVYWFEHVSYDDIPTYWGCTNNPVYRNHLQEKVVKAVSLGANALHLDDPRGSAWLDNGGCFCDFCTSAFRNHLQSQYTIQELAEMGVEDIDSFNYREVVEPMFETTDDFISAYRNREPIPMIQEYESFLYHRASDFLDELADVAKGVTKNPDFPISANTYNMEPRYMIGIEHLDLFVTEVDHLNHDGMEPVFAYKITNALGKRLILTANAVDWGVIKTGENTSLVHSWIATAYAFGHQFMTPYRQWVFVNHRQTTNYEGPTEVYAPIFRFVGDHPELFDGYESVAQVALVYNHNAYKWRNETIHEVCGQLAKAHIPFEILVAGDNWLSPRLEASSADKYQHIIIPDSSQLMDGQQTIVGNWLSDSRATYWQNAEALSEHIDPWIHVNGSLSVLAIARVSNDPENPVPAVIHLISQVTREAETFQKQEELNLVISQALLGDRKINGATFVSLFDGTTDLLVQSEGNQVKITIPELTLWGVVKLRSGIKTN